MGFCVCVLRGVGYVCVWGVGVSICLHFGVKGHVGVKDCQIANK